ncbi:hypothetical protein [Leisingera sp. ANG-Vp]|uniref:hypothetical protein n=1 Tax=Leisingera sp. ANG-Vp TaxID=1577896 RepID=UPI0012698A65|nr:hypothetical protein [Leisingera sp. ANG-Vp]
MAYAARAVESLGRVQRTRPQKHSRTFEKRSGKKSQASLELRFSTVLLTAALCMSPGLVSAGNQKNNEIDYAVQLCRTLAYRPAGQWPEYLSGQGFTKIQEDQVVETIRSGIELQLTHFPRSDLPTPEALEAWVQREVGYRLRSGRFVSKDHGPMAPFAAPEIGTLFVAPLKRIKKHRGVARAGLIKCEMIFDKWISKQNTNSAVKRLLSDQESYLGPGITTPAYAHATLGYSLPNPPETLIEVLSYRNSKRTRGHTIVTIELTGVLSN